MTRTDGFEARIARFADLVLGGGVVLALAVFLRFFYYYGWTRERQFVGWMPVILDYVGPLSIAILLLAARRLAPRSRIRLVLVLIAVTGSIYGFELLLESTGLSSSQASTSVMTLLDDSTNKKRDAAALTRKWGVEIDTRTPDEVIAAMAARGVEALPIVTPFNHLFAETNTGGIRPVISLDGTEVQPLGGVSHRAILLCNESGRWVDYTSDEHGFNNADGVWHVPHLDIAVLGDSYAHGYCVPPEQNFVARIRQRHPNTLNLGMAGDGPLLMLATLQEHVTRLKPGLVLWFYYEGNDLTDLQQERRNPLLVNYLKPDFTQPLLVRQHDIDRAIINELPRLRALGEMRRRDRMNNGPVARATAFATLAVLRQRLGLVGGVNAVDPGIENDFQTRNMQTFLTIVAEARRRVSAWGGSFYFVYLPEWARYTNVPSPGKAQREEVLRSVRALGIPVIDLDGPFQATGDPLSLFPFRSAAHYNEQGHQVVADTVLKSLEK